MSSPFCGACDRVRLTADGHWRTCLFARDESPLAPLMRAGADDGALAAVMVRAMLGKQAAHGIDEPAFVQPERPMSAIGG